MPAMPVMRAMRSTVIAVALLGCGRLDLDEAGDGPIINDTSAISLELLAGDIGGPGSVDGTGAAAHFNTPGGVAIDGAGNLYVADTSNDLIRKVSPQGVVMTIAGTARMPGSVDAIGPAARFSGPSSVAVDDAGNVYVADTGNDVIRKISPAGVVTTLAGTPGTRGSADGTGPAARFNDPAGVAVDGAGNVYVADASNDTIRKISPAGVVTTLAGAPGMFGSTDGTGPTARFSFPVGVAVDGAGNVYVADQLNQAVRKLTPGGVVTTLAIIPDNLAQALLIGPSSTTVDGAGNVYVADGNAAIYKISPAGAVTTLAGIADQFGVVDGSGSAARFAMPAGVAVDRAGNAYVADAGAHAIRKITPAGLVTTLAGTPYLSGSSDGTGAAARFSGPLGVAVDRAGNAYVADLSNELIRSVTPGGAVATLAGSAGTSGTADGPGAAALFSAPLGIAADSAGDLYVAEQQASTIRKIAAGGTVTTFAGTAYMFGSDDGIGAAARLSVPVGVAADPSGNLYVADTGTLSIRKITPAAVVSTLAGTTGTPGSTDGTGTAARFATLAGIAVDATGNAYVVDQGNHTIRKISPGGVVTTLAGTAGMPGSADGIGPAARFHSPTGIAVDSAGNAYVADTANATIRKIAPDGTVTTIAGTAGSYGILIGRAPRFSLPHYLAITGDSLIITDTEAVLLLRHGAR